MTGEWGLSWVVVTGASQGLGAALCEALAPLMGPGSHMLGIARSQSRLATTAQRVAAANPHVQFNLSVLDLSTASQDAMEVALEESLHKVLLLGQQLAKVVIIHNAGSLGPLHYLRDMTDQSAVKQYFDLNVSSVVTLNAVFLRLTKNVAERLVINISSLCAVQAMSSWGLYCAGKAARDMVFKVLALEEKDHLTVLNYAPGPLDNDMQTKARTGSFDKDIRAMFQSMKDEGKLLTCETSASKFIQVVRANKFTSGDHVDFYDEV